MADLNAPHPPGEYPVVIIGSGPGGLQTGYCFDRMGVNYAHISADQQPAGMFQRFPIFQRLISWTKPHTLVDRGAREYERYDWNSLISDEPENKSLVAEFMDGTSYFPARQEMEQGIAAFATRTGLKVRYGCRWEGTRSTGDGFVLDTSDGEYRCKVVIFAIGMTEPWKPDIPGLDLVPHYVETKEPRTYAGKRVFIIGKRNSGFELADGLLPWASQIVMASPRPTSLSVITRSLVGARARYVQPYEDHLLAGGNVVVDAAIERVERTSGGYRVYSKGTTVPGDLVLDVDEVIAATGFQVPLGDLPQLGVATFMQGRAPAQTPLWESPSVPGLYFAGSITQGATGMKKYGIPGNSAAVHGFRYNARVLSRHIAEKHLNMSFEDPVVEVPKLTDHLLEVATHAPELWNQRSYLAHVVELDPKRGALARGITPLALFVDSAGPDSVAIAVESDASGDIHPAVYVRAGGMAGEHLLPSAPFHNFETAEHRSQLTAVLDPIVR
jgi:thioredoxin reductase